MGWNKDVINALKPGSSVEAKLRKLAEQVTKATGGEFAATFTNEKLNEIVASGPSEFAYMLRPDPLLLDIPIGLQAQTAFQQTYRVGDRVSVKTSNGIERAMATELARPGMTIGKFEFWLNNFLSDNQPPSFNPLGFFLNMALTGFTPLGIAMTLGKQFLLPKLSAILKDGPLIPEIGSGDEEAARQAAAYIVDGAHVGDRLLWIPGAQWRLLLSQVGQKAAAITRPLPGRGGADGNSVWLSDLLEMGLLVKGVKIPSLLS